MNNIHEEFLKKAIRVAVSKSESGINGPFGAIINTSTFLGGR